MSIPDWVHDAIFYQIFPDRFFNGNHNNDPDNTQPWGATPTNWGFQGGDLGGILQKFDYLLDLGINAIYLNPIFQATSNHRYNTTDYYKIDPKLGTQDEFQKLLTLAHSKGVRIILDGVFNHCGRGFFAFNDILENQEHSPYRDWFHIKQFPVDAYSAGEATDYLGWWNMKSLPKFNTSNPQVRKYLLDIAKYWIKQGTDGWRLDVPNEINDDSFWAEFRQVVKGANPEAYILGEIWTTDSHWVGEGHFDGLMHYPVVVALVDLLVANTISVNQFADKVEGWLSYYPRENIHGMYVPLSSHDTERILTRMGNNLEKTRLAYLFQFAYPGAPAIYYGDETGLSGGKDPACRGAFIWEENKWNTSLRSFIKMLVGVRKEHEALRKGSYVRIANISNPDCYGFIRKIEADQVLVIINTIGKIVTTSVNLEAPDWKDGKILHDLLSPFRQYQLSEQKFEITLPAWGGTWLA